MSVRERFVALFGSHPVVWIILLVVLAWFKWANYTIERDLRALCGLLREPVASAPQITRDQIYGICLQHELGDQ